MNPSVGYRQGQIHLHVYVFEILPYVSGMHELLAPLYYAVYYDSIVESDNQSQHDPTVQELCSSLWVAADAWALFEAIMRSTFRWYEWREPPQSTGGSQSPLKTHVHLNTSEYRGSVDIKPYVTPIVQTCNDIQSNLLRTTDFALWQHLQATGIEPQIYGM